MSETSAVPATAESTIDHEARNKLVLANTGLVSVAIKKLGLVDYRLVGDKEDAYQIGLVALIRAAEKFKPERGFKFSTYAVVSIYRGLLRNLPKSSLFRVSEYLWLKKKLRRLLPVPAQATDLCLDHLPDNQDTLAHVDQRHDIGLLLEQELSPREQRVVYKRYWQEKTFSVIGEEEGVSPQYIDEILTQSFTKLRFRLNAAQARDTLREGRKRRGAS